MNEDCKYSFNLTLKLRKFLKVLTAAHCIHEKYQRRRNDRDIRLLFGAYDLNDRDENGVYSASPSDVILHPDWNPHTDRYDADIAAIILEYSVPITKFIQPICIPSSDLETTEGFVTGWGKSEDQSKPNENIPKELKVPLWTNEDCFLESPAIIALASRRTFCAGSRDGSGVCNGDSGGGLFVKSGDVFYLKGIVSASLIKDSQCDVSNFALYTNVIKFIDWIDVPSEHQSTSRQTQACGVMSSAAGLIQNGLKATAVQWPWAVIVSAKGFTVLIDGKSYTTFQVGTLISDRHVIADAMFVSKKENDKRVPIATDLIKLYFGVINIDDYASSNSLVLDGAEKISLHPDLGNVESMKFANFAVIKLKTLVTFSHYISPICLSSFNGDAYSLTGRFGYAVGMGYSETGKTKDRKYATMRIRNKEVCEREYETSLGQARDRSLYFCAGGDSQTNGCWADHPFYLKQEGKWFLHAFLNVAFNDGSGCRTDLSVLYELAGPYYQWIQKEIGFV